VEYRLRDTEKRALGNTPGVGEFKEQSRRLLTIRNQSTAKPSSCDFPSWGLKPDRAQSEQHFQDDGGKTWETNWVNKYTRIPK